MICDFCGFLAQVKSSNVKDINKLPSSVLGAAWRPQEERMNAGIYFPLYLVLVCKKEYSVFYLASDLQNKEIFVARKALDAYLINSAPLRDVLKNLLFFFIMGIYKFFNISAFRKFFFK